MVEPLLRGKWVVRSILHGGTIELFLVPASVKNILFGITKAVVCAILSVGWCI